MDYSTPNIDWYYFEDDSGNVDLYSEWFRDEYRNVFVEEAPRKPTEEIKFRFSPRFGISHPIGTGSKIFFNYGHFYSMPISANLYRVAAPEAMAGISYLADPYINPPRTIAYELGFEYNLFNTFLIGATGYYKDVTNQTGEVSYSNYDGSVEYTTVKNNHYADIRGAEFTLEKRFGRWITGWINYNYMVHTSGYFGRIAYFQDPRQQVRQGIADPKLEQHLAQPVARANISLQSPVDFGPRIAGMMPLADWLMGWLITYQAGDYITWDPLNTYELQNNLQMKAAWNVDLRLSKRIRFGRTNITILADIVNVFDIKNLNMESFADVNDYNDYMKSLNLEMYDDEQYTSRGYVGGKELVGDVYEYQLNDPKYQPNSDDFIDMPNLDHLWYLNPRHIWLGLQFEF
jgi:outer membrane receptor protein involved in Fe transport